jgi:hypothetical protein
MKYSLFLSTLLLSACTRGVGSPPTTSKQDTSIVFPKLFEEESIVLGKPGVNYNMDGASLQALMVAVNDFLPRTSPYEPCWSKPSAHRFLITRRGDIIFIDIYADIFACDWKLLGMDYGARYAISLDGRILRRLAEGEPDGSPPAPPPEPRDGGPSDGRDYSSMLGYTFPELPTVALPGRRDAGPKPSLPPSSQNLDGGSPDAGSAQDAGAFPDGGSKPGP